MPRASELSIGVTGASGFVGRALVRRLSSSGRTTILKRSTVPASIQQRLFGDAFDAAPIEGLTHIVHLAARAHEIVGESLEAYRADNAESTLRLAERAEACGIQRFVFLSSIHVHSSSGEAISEATPIEPETGYAQSKIEAEVELSKISARGRMEVVILRPTLVMGSGVKGNLAALLRLVAKGIPLPFRLVQNRRSFTTLESLIDIVELSLLHPRAAGEIFVVADKEQISTAELIQRIAKFMGKRDPLFPFPPSLVSAAFHVIGRGNLYTKLFSDLTVNTTKAENLLGWHPATTLDNAIREMVSTFASGRSVRG